MENMGPDFVSIKGVTTGEQTIKKNLFFPPINYKDYNQ